MASLGEQIWTRPHKLAGYHCPHRGYYKTVDLEQSHALTVKLKQMGQGRIEGVVRNTNLQRIMDMSDPHNRPRGRRLLTGDRDVNHVERARIRARQAVRSICMRINADRMLTITTRVTLPLETLLTRFQRFVRAYQKKTGVKFLYCAIPEPHKEKEHFHLHVAAVGFFDLKIANAIWYALCADDDVDHPVNGNIDVRVFRARSVTEDTPSMIAGYISKYVGKVLGRDFNKKSYWAARIGAQEVSHRILRATSLQEALNELRDMLGINWTSVIMTHAGCFFPLPDDSGFWFKLTPEMARDIPF